MRPAPSSHECQTRDMADRGGEFELGLYETPITQALAKALRGVDPDLVSRRALSALEAPDRVALHLRREIESALGSIPEAERVEVALGLIDTVLASLMEVTGESSLSEQSLIAPGEVLESITSFLPDGSPREIRSPLISLLDTTLLTNANREPRVGVQLLAEIESSSHIDVLVAFVRRSGLRPMLAALRKHCDSGGSLRVLTTTYTGSTEREALDDLTALGAEVKVSYDTTSTRLHAKAWLFERASGFSTAYIGSSNLTNMALHDGLEWNMRVSGARNPDVINKVQAVFESYWQSGNFADFNPTEFDAYMESMGPKESTGFVSPIEVTARPFQNRLLDLLQLERDRGRHRNLIVAATGTGKTVMAALDYVRLARSLPQSRMLFVAHREEILEQSRSVFRQVTQDHAFGEMWVGGSRPRQFEHVFASVQTLAKVDLDKLDPTHFDVVIVDEFHHAAATTYERLLHHLNPVELIGLTATPERADGTSILHWFDDRIAAELRLWDAIEQQYLAPFAYFGIHDGLDLSDVPWKRGRGYDTDALTTLLTADDIWAKRVIQQFLAHVDSPSSVRALGFCVSVAHADFMAAKFNQAGIKSVSISGKTPDAERTKALRDFRAGNVRVVFSVDIFNEGVDVPSVDALLMLRPTESATIFLQQLGRGLRKSESKPVCLVLDFVGHHREEFRFDLKLRALLGGTRKDLERQIKEGFPYLPAGCHMELDAVAADVILRSLKSAIPANWTQRVAELVSMAQSGRPVSLARYLEETSLDLEDVYANSRCWSDLREAAGLSVGAAGPNEVSLRRALGRLLHVNDEVRLTGWTNFLKGPKPEVSRLVVRDQRLLRMLIAQLFVRGDLKKDSSLQDGVDALWGHAQVVTELTEIFEFLRTRVDHLQSVLPGRPNVPLLTHGCYTRIEILAGFGQGDGATTDSWREGVRWLPDEKADLLAFTLDKSDGGFSATTSYRDFAISPGLIHWETQNSTRSASPTGQRYQNHVEMSTEVFLFARTQTTERSFWLLGPGSYVSHVGERPMAITWSLETALPGDLFAAFAAAVA